MRRLIYLIIIVVILFSCKNKKNNSTEVNREKSIKSKLKKVQENKNEQNIFWNYEVNIQNVKSQINDVTSGFLSKKEIQIFPKRREDKYYGFYTLLKNDDKGTPSIRVGKMIIYDSINPYKYEKNTDEFVEITLRKKGVSLLKDKLQIGMSIGEIQKTFGECNKELDGGNILIYKKENKIAVLNFKNNILTKIKIGIYKKDIDLKEVIDYPN